MGRSRSVSFEVHAIAQHTCPNGKNVVAVPRNQRQLPDTRAAVLWRSWWDEWRGMFATKRRRLDTHRSQGNQCFFGCLFRFLLFVKTHGI